MAKTIDPNDFDNLAKSLASLGVSITPILESAGITTVPIGVFGLLEHYNESQLQSIKTLCAIVNRLTGLHKELQQYAPDDVRQRHQHTVTTLLSGYEDSLDLSSDKV